MIDTKTIALPFFIVLVACLVFWALWDKERATHQATIKEYTQKEAVYKANEIHAGNALKGLQMALEDLDASFTAYKSKEKERQNIMEAAKPRQRTPEERERTVDDATRQKAADFLNTW